MLERDQLLANLRGPATRVEQRRNPVEKRTPLRGVLETAKLRTFAELELSEQRHHVSSLRKKCRHVGGRPQISSRGIQLLENLTEDGIDKRFWSDAAGVLAQ